MIDPKDYSKDDLNLYYSDSYVYHQEDGLVKQVVGFREDDVFLRQPGGDEEIIRVSMEEVDDNPAVNQLRNTKYGAIFLHKFSHKQFRIGLTNENSKIIPVKVGAKDLMKWVDGVLKYSELASYFYEDQLYPDVKEAERKIKEGYMLSCAFSPHFALAIPVVGDDLVVTKHEYPIGYLCKGKVLLAAHTMQFKEELEQYVEVSNETL